MTRVKISDFGIIQKVLALATVTFYETASDGSNSGTKATLYRSATGTDVYPNPQILTEDGQLASDVYVEKQVLCTITGISERTERGIRKIKQTPTEYQLPVTSATWAKQAGEDLYGDLAAVQAAVDSVEAVLADAGFIAVSGDLLGANTIGTVASNIGNVNTVGADLSGDNTVGTVAADLAVADNIGTVAGSIANVDAVGSNIGSVLNVDGNEANINIVSAAVTDVQAVATYIANVVAVALDLTAINAVYADLTKIDAVYADLSNINLVSADLTNINLVAVDLANIDIVVGIAGDVSDVAAISTQIQQLALITDEIVDAANNIPKSNRTATTDPTVNDDSGDGYSEASIWVNTSTNNVFFCADASAGSAAWISVTAAGTLATLGDVSLTSVASGDMLHYNGSLWVNRTPAQVRADLSLEVGTDVQAYSSVLDNTTASFTTAQETKLGYITVTQAVDLDAIETRVNALDSAIILMGTWDASSGSFPGSGTAQAGESYIVSVGGTVDGETFTVNDRIIAITDNASTTTFAANWFKADYTDQVLSVAGQTGAVTLAQADISGLTTADSPQFTALNVGHASDTTITRVSAGVIAVEGSNVLLASGLGSVTQAYDAELAAFAGLTSAADKLGYFTGAGTMSTTDFTSTARTLLADTSTSAMRTTLGLVIGTDVQAYDATLAALTEVAAQATTSGTAIDFSSLPTGIKTLQVKVNLVSLDTTSPAIIQIGDATGGLKTSGYTGSGEIASTGQSYTAGFPFTGTSVAGTQLVGVGILSRLDSSSNTWTWSFVGGNGGAANSVRGGGVVTLSGALDRLRITSVSGTANFDNGSVSISYLK